MIDLCIENNIQIKGINLIKFRSLRNTINNNIPLADINIKEFEECKI